MAAAPASGRKRILKEEDMTKVEFETSEEVDVTPTFDTMGLREDLLRGIYAYGTVWGLGPAPALAHVSLLLLFYKPLYKTVFSTLV